MLWSRVRPPNFQPDAVLTRRGWTHPTTGELLVVMFSPWIGPGPNIIQEMEGAARIQRRVEHHQSGCAQIVYPPTKLRKQYVKGCARIVPAPPVYTGVNSEWFNGINPEW